MLNTEIRNRIQWVDVLKCFGILSVIIGHIYRNQQVLDWFYTYHMPLFFLAGGLVYKKRNVLSDIKSRLYSTVVPYFVFGSVIALYWFFIERSFRDIEGDLGTAFLGLLSGQYSNLEFHSHLWFLPCFFITAVVYNIIVNIGGRYLAYILSAAMAVLWIFVPLPELPWGIDRAVMYMAYYAVGHALKEHGAVDKISGFSPAVKGVGCGVLLVASLLLSYFRLVEGVMYYVTALVGIAAFVLLSMLAERVAVLQYIGRITLVTLCIHGPIYRVIVKLVSIPMDCATDEVRSNIMLVVLITAATVVLCASAYELLKRFLPWIIGVKLKKLEKTDSI